MHDSLAPVALFVYNRPKQTKNVIDSLHKNKLASSSDLYVFCDGSKKNASKEQIKRIEEVRDFVKTIQNFRSVTIIERSENFGLAKSVIEGVSEVITKHGKVIVIEDDLILSVHCLSYMNDSLNTYKNDLSVGQIAGCNFFACGDRYPEIFFVPVPDCLGWATWENRWSHLIKDNKSILNKIDIDKDLLFRFNAYGSYDFHGLLKHNINNKVDSWAILWHATCIFNNWSIIYANPSMTNHIASIDATHANINIQPPLAKKEITQYTKDIRENPEVIKAMKLGYSGNGDYYGNIKKKSRWLKFKNYLRKLLHQYY